MNTAWLLVGVGVSTLVAVAALLLWHRAGARADQAITEADEAKAAHAATLTELDRVKAEHVDAAVEVDKVATLTAELARVRTGTTAALAIELVQHRRTVRDQQIELLAMQNRTDQYCRQADRRVAEAEAEHAGQLAELETLLDQQLARLAVVAA